VISASSAKMKLTNIFITLFAALITALPMTEFRTGTRTPIEEIGAINVIIRDISDHSHLQSVPAKEE
jgi:hypothetical protein